MFVRMLVYKIMVNSTLNIFALFNQIDKKAQESAKHKEINNKQKLNLSSLSISIENF